MRRRATPLSHLYPGTPWCRAKSKMEQTPQAKYGNGQHLQYPGAALDMLSLLQLVLHTFSRNLDCWAKGVFFLFCWDVCRVVQLYTHFMALTKVTARFCDQNWTMWPNRSRVSLFGGEWFEITTFVTIFGLDGLHCHRTEPFLIGSVLVLLDYSYGWRDNPKADLLVMLFLLVMPMLFHPPNITEYVQAWKERWAASLS